MSSVVSKAGLALLAVGSVLASLAADGTSPASSVRVIAPGIFSYPESAISASRQSAPPTTSYVDGGHAASTCSPLIDFELTNEGFAYYFDSTRRVSDLFVSGGGNWDTPILRHEIDAQLNHAVTVLPIPNGWPGPAADLDGDGQIDLVVQHGNWVDSYVDIYSAPDWRSRAHLTFPGMNVVMHPWAVNIDADPYLELFLTPTSLDGAAQAALIKYDPVRDTFAVIADIDAPYGTGGDPAVGDFDGDGRMEFISGNYWGYGLFEYDGRTLSYIGLVGPDSTLGSYRSAVACRPKPDGVLYALLGSSGFDAVYRAWLLKPAGGNRFDVVRTFQEQGLGNGSHVVYAADIDCDGLDELLMNMASTKVWEWDSSIGDFVVGCSWDHSVNPIFVQVQATDLNQNGAWEWSTVNPRNQFRCFEDPRCGPCSCSCHADPTCDGITDILDVVGAINVAFGSEPEHADLGCPRSREDVDCNGVVDLIDVVKMINVAIRGMDRATQFCNPCQ